MSEQHEAATDDGDIRTGFIHGQIMHVIAGQAIRKPLLDTGRGKATQQKVQHTGVALAGRSDMTITLFNRRCNGHGFLMTGEPAQAFQQTVGLQCDIGIKNQENSLVIGILQGLTVLQCEIMATTVTNITVARQQVRIH